MNNKKNLDIKKRIMFNKEEDYYFITYNVLVFLNTLKCVNESDSFLDYTKLTYIIPFISNHMILDIIARHKDSSHLTNSEEIELLKETYYKSRLKVKLLTSILFALEQNEYIALKKNPTRHTVDVWIRKDKIPESFFDSDLYNIEIAHTKKLKEIFPKIRSLTVSTLLQRLFSDNGVKIW